MTDPTGNFGVGFSFGGLGSLSYSINFVVTMATSLYARSTKAILRGMNNILGESYLVNQALQLLALYDDVETALLIIFAVVGIFKIAIKLPQIFRYMMRLVKGIPEYRAKLQKMSKLSWKWHNVRRRLGREGWALPYQEVHHKYIPRGGKGKLTFKGFFKEQWGRFVPDIIKNQKWNLMPTESKVMHDALHGKGDKKYKLAKRLWYGSGPVFKGGVLTLSVATAWVIDSVFDD